MMKRLIAFLLIAFASAFAAGCGFLDPLLGRDRQPTAATQWADVPLPEGVQRQNADIPLPMRIALDLFIRPALEQEGMDLRNFEFVTYTAPQVPQEVSAFYTKERMRTAGWSEKDSLGCLASAELGIEGTYCLFLRGEGEQQTALVILVSKREAGGSDLTFVRFKSNLFPLSPTP